MTGKIGGYVLLNSVCNYVKFMCSNYKIRLQYSDEVNLLLFLKYVRWINSTNVGSLNCTISQH